MHLDDITWTPLLIFWEVISHPKFSGSFYQISHECDWWNVTCGGGGGTFVFIFIHVISLSLMDTFLRGEERERLRITKLCFSPLSVPERRQSSVICRRKFLARRVMSTSTRTTCSTLQRSTGKVMEQLNIFNSLMGNSLYFILDQLSSRCFNICF